MTWSWILTATGLSNFFPLDLHTAKQAETLLDKAGTKPNLSDAAAAYLAQLKAAPEELFYHTLAVLHAPAYRTENGGALRQDWPRVPLPDTKKKLAASAELGRAIAALLDTERGVPGVTDGQIKPELKTIAKFTRPMDRPLNEETDFAVTAGWGHAGKEGICMPAKGKIVKRDSDGRARPPGAPNPCTEADGPAVRPHLGQTTYDIYLNESACWRNIPVAVWEYTLGSYQVIKKWLRAYPKTLARR